MAAGDGTRGRKALGLMLALLGGQAGHWLLTPHPDASQLRTLAVTIQGLAAWIGFLRVAWPERHGARRARERDA